LYISIPLRIFICLSVCLYRYVLCRPSFDMSRPNQSVVISSTYCNLLHNFWRAVLPLLLSKNLPFKGFLLVMNKVSTKFSHRWNGSLLGIICIIWVASECLTQSMGLALLHFCINFFLVSLFWKSFTASHKVCNVQCC